MIVTLGGEVLADSRRAIALEETGRPAIVEARMGSSDVGRSLGLLTYHTTRAVSSVPITIPRACMAHLRGRTERAGCDTASS